MAGTPEELAVLAGSTGLLSELGPQKADGGCSVTPGTQGHAS